MTQDVSKLKSFVPDIDNYTPTLEEQNIIRDIFNRFTDSVSVRNASYAYFDGRTLLSYINDSVERFTTNLFEREGIEDWQARANNQITRNKVLAVLGKLVSILPIAQFIGRGEEDSRKGIILTNLYEYAEEIDDYEELMIFMLLESIVKGTAIGYEGVDVTSKKVRNVKGSNDNITISEKEERRVDLPGSIVPLEEFYPSSVGIRNIKKMPYCFWRNEISYSEFMDNWYPSYKRAKLVQPHSMTVGEDTAQPFYRDFITNLTQEGNVEIIRYYDKVHDQYVIIANGIWLNPVVIKETMNVSPLPWNHKELPFWDIKFDFFGSDFFYGKSLPDRLKSLQDVINVLTNMLLDQSFLSIFAPILMSGFDDIEDDYLRPGRRITVDTGGLPLNQATMRLDPGTPGGWHQYILQYTQSLMEQASVDQVNQGVAGVGERTTAKEISVAAEGVSSILGLTISLVKFGIKRKALLKAANIMQFWTDPKTPMIQMIGGEEDSNGFNKSFNSFVIDGAVLTDGKRGTTIIEMYKDKKDRPSRKELQTRGELASINANKKIEIHAILPSYIRNLQTDIKLGLNTRSEASKEIEKALQLEKVRIYMSFFPNQVNVDELAAQTAEKLGDDPTKILLKDTVNRLLPEENTEIDKGVSTQPNQNVSNNMIRGQGGNTGANQLGQLAQMFRG